MTRSAEDVDCTTSALTSLQVFELLVQKNATEHELQRSAAAAAAAVQQAMRGRHEAESAAKHSKTRLDAAAAEIQALQAQVSNTLRRAAAQWTSD